MDNNKKIEDIPEKMTIDISLLAYTPDGKPTPVSITKEKDWIITPESKKRIIENELENLDFYMDRILYSIYYIILLITIYILSSIVIKVNEHNLRIKPDKVLLQELDLLLNFFLISMGVIFIILFVITIIYNIIYKKIKGKA